MTVDNTKLAKVIWFTGLSGSGKTTLSEALYGIMRRKNMPVCLLDGDILRQGLCKDLGFSRADREENLRRTAEVARLFWLSDIYVLAAFISPLSQGRNMARTLFPAGQFIEVFVDAPLSTCELRDPKGLYKKARSGQIKDFTGIDSPYEPPTHADLVLRTSESSVDECLKALLEKIGI